MTAERLKFTDGEWENWLNATHEAIMELFPGEQEIKLAEFFVEVSDLIDQGLYPMTREGFSMFMRDLYATHTAQE